MAKLKNEEASISNGFLFPRVEEQHKIYTDEICMGHIYGMGMIALFYYVKKKYHCEHGGRKSVVRVLVSQMPASTANLFHLHFGYVFWVELF